MSDQPQTENKPESRVSANALIEAINNLNATMLQVGMMNQTDAKHIIDAINKQSQLIQTQNGLLGALLAKSGKPQQQAPNPQASAAIQQASQHYPSMTGGGGSHVPGQLTGLEPPQWTGEAKPMGAQTFTPSAPTPLPTPRH